MGEDQSTGRVFAALATPLEDVGFANPEAARRVRMARDAAAAEAGDKSVSGGVYAALMHPREGTEEVIHCGGNRLLIGIKRVIAKLFGKLDSRGGDKSLSAPGGDHE